MIKPKKHLANLIRMPRSSGKRAGTIMRLDQNERTTPIAEDVVREIFGNLPSEELVAYPELTVVYQLLAQRHDLNQENILLFDGSDSGIKSLFEVFVEPTDEVLTLVPSYGMFFVYPKMFGAELIQVGYAEDFSLPIKNILKKISIRTKLVLIANPNHTGTAMPHSDLEELIKATNNCGSLILIDEAYFEFHGETIMPLVSCYDNLVVSRTMSKAFGLASFRVGYLASCAENIQNLAKVRATHEITAVSARFTEYMLGHPDIMEHAVREINAGKEYLLARSKELRIQVFESRANFVFMRLPSNVSAEKVVEGLKKRKIFIKGPFGVSPVKGMVRVTVGPPWQMKIFLDELKELVNV